MHSRHQFTRHLVLLAIALPAFAASPGAASRLSFEPNLGQFDSRVKYVARTRHDAIALHPDGVRFSRKSSSKDFAIRFPRANRLAPAEPGPTSPGRINYYPSNDRATWRVGVETRESIAFRGVYRGVDVIYHGSGDSLEYDFRLAPHADARQIRVAFDGVKGIEIGSDGAVHSAAAAGAGQGAILQRKPVAYQEIAGIRSEVPVRIVPAGRNQVAFSLGAYDANAPLVIDPTILYSTYLSGSSVDTVYALKADANGNAFVVGRTDSRDFPVKPTGGTNVYGGGTNDGFAAGFTPAGALIFATYLGGNQYDGAYNLALDPSGNVIVAGETSSKNFPIMPANAFQTSNIGIDMGFVTKLNATGAIVASTYVGGSVAVCDVDQNAAYGVASDPSGNVYVTGQTCTTNFPAPTRLPGALACFVVKLNPALTAATYATLIGGTRSDYCNAIAVDAAGSAYLTGGAFSSGLATTGAFQTKVAGGTFYGDSFVAKLDPAGAVSYFTYLGGFNDESGSSIQVDSAGNAYVTGWTLSADFPVAKALQPHNLGGTGRLPCGCPAGDAFITEVNPTGAGLVYSTYFGSTQDDAGEVIAVDSSGRTYVYGMTNSKTIHQTAGALQPGFAGGNADQDTFLLVLSAGGGAIEYFSYFGGTAIDESWGLDLDAAGNIYIGGETDSLNLPTVNPYQSTHKGSTAGFVTAIAALPSSAPVISKVVNGASFLNAVAPGSWATVFGTTLVTGANFNAAPLPTTLAGASIQINGISAPLYYADAAQVNFIMPSSVAPGPAQAVLFSGGQSSAPFSFTVSQSAPGIFVYGNNRAVAQNYPAYSLNSATNAAPAGSTVIVYLAGPGPVTNPAPDGALVPSSPFSKPTLPYSATIGAANAPITFLGYSPGFIGLMQANMKVPPLSPGDYPVLITIGGATSNGPLLGVK